MQAYKIVKVLDDGRRVSAYATNARVDYKPRCWTKGLEGTPLFIHREPTTYRIGDSYECWLVDAVGVRPVQRVSSMLGARIKTFSHFWKALAKGRIWERSFHVGNERDPMLVADRVKLRRRIAKGGEIPRRAKPNK
jgi:hypothetical protein